MLLKLFPHHVNVDLEELLGSEGSKSCLPSLSAFGPLIFDSQEITVFFSTPVSISSPAQSSPHRQQKGGQANSFLVTDFFQICARVKGNL